LTREASYKKNRNSLKKMDIDSWSSWELILNLLLLRWQGKKKNSCLEAAI